MANVCQPRLVMCAICAVTKSTKVVLFCGQPYHAVLNTSISKGILNLCFGAITSHILTNFAQLDIYILPFISVFFLVKC